MKPEFNSHEGLSSLSCQAHLMAEALLCYADDEGYFNANPGLVRAGTCPLRPDFRNISGILTELSGIDYIHLGSFDGKRYGRVVHFKDHQLVSHPRTSKIATLPIEWDSGKSPEPSGAIPVKRRKPPESLRPEQGTGNGTGNREQGMPHSGKTPECSSSETPDGSTSKTNTKQAERLAAVKEVFAYYLEQAGRNPSTYTLTENRRKKGLARLGEALRIAHGDLPGAVSLMKAAVDELAASDFHMGRNPKTQGKSYCEWEDHLFHSTEQFEKWLQRVQEAITREEAHA